MAPNHAEIFPLVRGVYDSAVAGFQPPELYDGGDEHAIYNVAHAAGSLACIGQCLEPGLEGMIETARRPATALKGSTLRIDTQRTGVTALADRSGQWPLFYANRGDRIHYSSNAEDLAQIVGDRVDATALACYIVGGEFLAPHRTAYEHISRLPAGHMLHMDRLGAAVERYAAFVPDTSVRLQDTADEIRTHLQDAESLWPGDSDSQFYAFSGGLDSTSLAFLGTSQLLPGRLLHAHHVQRVASLSGDTAYALAFAKLNPRIDLAHIIIPDSTVPYDDLAASGLHYPFAHVEGPMRKIMDSELGPLAVRGAKVNITGEGGDALFTAPTQYLADLAEHPFRNAGRLFREGTLQAHRREIAFSGLIRELRARSGFTRRDALSKVAAAIRDGDDDQQLAWHHVSGGALTLLPTRMRGQLAELVYGQSETAVEDPTVGIADYINTNQVHLSGTFTANLRRLSNIYGIATRAPFLDDPVIDARSRLQTHLTANPRQFKQLLQETLHQYVPPEVFARRSKGNYTREVYEGIRKNAALLRGLFGSGSYLAAIGVIDPNAMQQLITKAELGQSIPLDVLERATTVELWLREHYGGEPPPAREHRSTAPAQQNTPDTRPFVPSEALPKTVRVPPHILMAHTDIGVVAFNMKDSVANNLHAKAALVLTALQQRGEVADAAVMLRTSYPAADANRLSQELTEILTNMLRAGTIEAGTFTPFTIRPAQQRTNDAAGDVPMMRGEIDTSGVRLRDYLRMGRALLRATSWTKTKNQFEITQELERRKRGLPPADAESIRRHMVAGHVLGRYSLFKEVVCADLSTAMVLAEAGRGRAAQYIVAYVPDPNYYHAAPGVNNTPVQTPQDRIMDDNFTILGIF